MTQNIFDTLNQSSYIFYFLVVDEFLDISLPQLKNFHLIYAYKNKNISNSKNPYFCLEEQGISLSTKNSGKLLSHPKVVRYIKTTSNKLQSVIIPFKPSSKIEYLCKKNNWINAALSSKLNRFLEDKNQFYKFCKKNKLPVIPSFLDTFNQNNFIKYQQKLGNQLVIQSHFGWAGNSTFSANNWNGIKNSLPKNTLVKFSPFIAGYSLTNNCCLTKTGLIQSQPALQLTGIKPLTDNPFATVGRKWPSMAPKKVINKIKKITIKYAKSIKKIRYLGFFGLDFLVNQKNKIYLLECNPRLTASFAFYTQLEIKQNLTPLFLLHLIQFLKIKFPVNTKKIQKQLNFSDVSGTEITQKRESQTIAKYQQFKSLIQKPNLINIPKEIISKLHA